MLGGVSDHGTCQEDDPVTWEASPFLGARTGQWVSLTKITDAPWVEGAPAAGTEEAPNPEVSRVSKGEP